MKKIFTKEAKIGLVSIISLALLYFGINYLKGINLFKPANHYEVVFHNVKDVTVSSPVFIDGFKVGLVRSLTFDYETMNKTTVEISLEKEMRINKGSYISITKSFLGGAELHIHLNKYVSEYYKPGDVIEGRMGEDMMTAVETKVLPQVEMMLPKIDSILIGLQTLVNHPALAQTFANMEATTANLHKSTTLLNNVLAKDIPVIVANLKTITNDFSSVSMELKGLDFKQTFNAMNGTLNNLKLTTDKLNSPNNSLGLLLNDKQLYENLNSTADNASKLLYDLKQNPKRYVHFSVF
ncbi:MlaD family protein [Parabacteroides pacaensis]|uniref:MlaD family protein n=1 Tax=Parabacteroides pacaensis TaxID=2086575 RepID=UPI000D0FF1C2|nr:MlaD family protein [Parabacteroides pacaensis]